MLSIVDLIILCLAAIRIDLLLRVDDGPYMILEKIRHHAGVRYDDYGKWYATNEFSKMIMCPYCNSIWVSALLFLIYHYISIWVLLPLAISMSVVIHEELV